MRHILSLSDSWRFHKEGQEESEILNLPHTWNAVDGMDGGGDYWRGTGIYEKTLTRSELPQGERIYLEFRGANSSADVYVNGGEKLDNVGTHFGFRTFSVDPERGFLLNGREYPLRGVARHQDRIGFGNALLREHHNEDIELIRELGATTIRLAHYQHDQYFYTLCDEAGLVIWAEIPYISQHMPEGRDNTVSQMTELITQCYNHPSICFWGLSNEITMNGAEDPDLIVNHRILNKLVKKMDPIRLTTVAVLSMCPMDATHLTIPDVVSYNHYFGWYGGMLDLKLTKEDLLELNRKLNRIKKPRT